MPNPAWITSENVKFKGTLSNAAVLKNSGGVRSLILWDNLSDDDKTTLTAFVDANGGTLPLAGPTSGSQLVDFSGSVVGGNATGLSSVATATAGVATINLGASAVGGNASGLSSASGTYGSQVVNFTPTLTAGLSTGVAPVAGYQYINFSALAAGSDATSLVGGTTYTTTITVDGVAKPISILGSAAQTFTTLVSEINTDLGVSATATLDVANKRIVITSATLGTTSSVVSVQGTLFAAPLANFLNITASVAGTGSVAALTATVVVDGVSKPISILPTAITTFGGVITELNTDLGASATAAIVGGDIKITSATTGTTSTVVITAGTLFPALTGFSGVLPSQSGKSTTRDYSATVIIDGTIIKSVKFTGIQGDTFTHVISELNTDLGASATAAITGGNITITSATTGASSSVSVLDTGFLFNQLTGYAKITTTAGVAPKLYTAVVTIDGVAKPISIQGSAAQTFTTLISEINTDLGVSATAAIVGGNIKITSATTGLSSSVFVTDGDLFKALGAYGFRAPVAGITDLLAAAKISKVANGSRVSEHFNILTVGTKPAVPPFCPHNVNFIYWDGLVWKYLDNDVTV